VVVVSLSASKSPASSWAAHVHARVFKAHTAWQRDVSRRDTVRALASDLGVPEDAVVATVMKQLMESLQVWAGSDLFVSVCLSGTCESSQLEAT
jgi:hypothetical protein